MIKGPPRDGECRSNLRSVIALEVGFFELNQRYTTNPAELGFAPTAGNRYLYRFAPTGPLNRRDGKPSAPTPELVGIGPDTGRRNVTLEWLDERMPPDVRASLGLAGECPGCQLTVGCVGNIDDDDDVDVWSIATFERLDASGKAIARGTPMNHLSDR